MCVYPIRTSYRQEQEMWLDSGHCKCFLSTEKQMHALVLWSSGCRVFNILGSQTLPLSPLSRSLIVSSSCPGTSPHCALLQFSACSGSCFHCYTIPSGCCFLTFWLSPCSPTLVPPSRVVPLLFGFSLRLAHKNPPGPHRKDQLVIPDLRFLPHPHSSPPCFWQC